MDKKIFGLLILAGLMLPIAAKANTVGPAFESTLNSQSTGTDFTFGVVFKPTVNVWVDYLGYYDPTGGMDVSHAVAIYSSTGGAPLASTTVTSSSAYSTTHFLYNAITPIELLAGDTYVLDGYSGTDPYGAVTSANKITDGFTLYAPITILGDNDISGLSLTDTGTTNHASTANYYGADFGFYVTPEPSTLLLLGSGLAGLAGLLKRKLSA